MAGEAPSDDLKKELVTVGSQGDGAIASPDLLQFAPVCRRPVPKRIIRRILRGGSPRTISKISATHTTLADPTVVDDPVSNRQNNAALNNIKKRSISVTRP